MNKNDVEAVRRVREHLFKLEKKKLIEERDALYAKWIEHYKMKDVDFQFTQVTHQVDVFVHHYTFEFLVEMKYFVSIHFDNESDRNVYQMRTIINKVDPQKNIYAESYRQRIVAAIRDDVIKSYRATRGRDELFERQLHDMEKKVKNALLTL